MSARSALYVGEVFHRRTRPTHHSLRYRVFSLLLDLEEIDALAASLWPLSRNRFNLFAFHDRDFGDGGEGTLADYVVRELAAAGIGTPPARILLSCCPRVLGHAFNPLSLYWCLDETGQVFAVVHEVHNTFGERHAYALAARPDANSRIRQRADKELFVSPFNPMHLRYEFRLRPPGERQVVIVRVFDGETHVMTASHVAARRPLDTRSLLRALAAYPLMTIGVLPAIHWEALLLWRKRAPLFPHRAKEPAGTGPRRTDAPR